MTRDELRDFLLATGPAVAAGAAALAPRVRNAASALAAETVALSAHADAAVALRARMLAGDLEELAVDPLLTQPTSGLANELWRAATATAAAVRLRARVAERLRTMLADHRPVPAPPADPRLEAAYVPRRVCDEAYRLLRELTASELRTDLAANQWTFLRLAEPDRDAEIAGALAGQDFARLTEDLEA